jgi:hypothetical protein
MLRAPFGAILFPLLLAAADRNVILVTADGLRWQELLHGIDPLLAREKSVSMDPANKELPRRPTIWFA